MSKLVNKIIASMLILIMLLAYTATIGIYGRKVYANENSLEVQGVKTNNENVEFDAYFVKNKSKVHEVENKISQENSVYVEVSVKNAGYLKNAKIEFIGSNENSKANFQVKEQAEENQQVAKVNTQNNSVELNQISKNEKANVAIPIYFDAQDQISLNDFSRENIAKLTGTYIDEKGKEKAITAQIKLKLNWNETPEIAVEEQITKYVPYDINGQKQVMLQTIVKTSLVNNSLPVKETNLEIIVPSIANTKPTTVKVASASTKATNGEENEASLTEEQYNYNQEQGILTIKVENKADENNNVIWKKQAQDEFIITYVYPEEILTNMPEEGNKVGIITNANITTYGMQEVTINKSVSGEAILKDKIGEIVDFKVESNVEELSKGYIYANYQATEKIETEYEEKITANIGLADITDSLTLYSNVDKFVYDENTKGDATEYTKQLKIEKAIFDKFLGEEGYLNIYLAETLLSSINKDTQVDEEGNIKVDLSEFNANQITIQTSKPLVEGTIEITITKALKGEIEYNKTQMRSFSSLEIIVAGEAINNAVAFNKQVVNKTIALTEPTSKAELTINNTNLSTIVTNENVEIKAILKTNSLDCNLYTNPTITITMPSYIESINVKDVQVLFDEELKIKEANLIQNADGTKAIVLQLEGTQTKYNIGNIAGGTNIIITADITVNKLTPNTDAEIKMNYTNENVIQAINTRMLRSVSAQVEQNEIATAVSFVAPTGIVTMNGIAGYKDGAEELTSISGEEKIGEIEIMSAAREATFNMSVMNNYNNTIENIVVLGRTPFKGNKTIETAKDLGSTMDLNLTTPITVAGVDSTKVTIYYSENGEATKDLTNTANGWSTAPSNLASVKSYLIVINNHVMNKAETITFSYNAQIPANLQHNQSSFETYAVYFQNNLEAGKVQDKQETAKVGVTTGQGPVLEANITSSVAEDEVVLTDDFIKYTITVKNAGDTAVENVVATAKVPEHTNYVEFTDFNKKQYEEYKGENKKEKVTYDLGTIKPGETTTRDFWVKVERFTYTEINQKETITTNIQVIAKDLEQVIQTDNVTNKIRNRMYPVIIRTDIQEDNVYKEGDTIEIYIYPSYLNEDYKDAILTVNVPEGLIFEKIAKESDDEKNDEISANYDAEKNTVSIDYEIEQYEGLIVTYKVGQITKQNIDIISYVIISNSEITEKSNEIINTINLTSNEAIEKSIGIEHICSIPQGTTISMGEEFSYKISIKNTGNVDVNLKIEDYLPEELICKKLEYNLNGIVIEDFPEEGETIEKIINVKKNETIEIIIYVIANYIEDDTQISNNIKAYIVNFTENEEDDEENENYTIEKELEVNTITHTLEAEINTNIDDSGSVTKRISGQVWLDENKDGSKDEEETKISNVEVMLLNNKTGALEKDNNGDIIKQTTSEEGAYTFKGIAQGKYTLIFLYDTANYSSTSYKKDGVNEIKNSDAIDTQITLDGKSRQAAITEEIIVSDSNIYNIDLGLVVNPKFDLKLDKTVSSITVQNSTGTKTYNYEDSKLAKRDLVGKEISSTTIVVEYKIKVTNEGAVSGYAKKIVDYMPEELKFSSELNKDWYQGENGAIYNSSLSNTIINPGETKEITLLLTKKLTDENIGLIQNTAEIYEAYNDLGLEDIDSIEANKVTNEDDQSSADILLTVKTGETVIFIGLTITIISTIAIGAYIVKKKILG